VLVVNVVVLVVVVHPSTGHGKPVGNCRQSSSSTIASALASRQSIRSFIVPTVAPGHVPASGQPERLQRANVACADVLALILGR
jgi:hypothetical protein